MGQGQVWVGVRGSLDRQVRALVETHPVLCMCIFRVPFRPATCAERADTTSTPAVAVAADAWRLTGSFKDCGDRILPQTVLALWGSGGA